jgi:hypothetical protein
VVSLLLGKSVGAITLIVVDTNTLVVLEVTSHESALVRVLAHTEASDSNAVQGVHVIVCRTGVLRVLGLLRGRSSRDRARGAGIGDGGTSHGEIMTGLAQINVWGKIGDINGGFHEAALHCDDVVTERVVLVEQSLELLTETFDTLILSFQLADVGLLALAKSTL